MQLKNLHYLSGLLLSVFIGFHLFNHLMAWKGAEMHISTMEKFRGFYRHPIVESILLISVFIQVFSGIRLVKKGSKTASQFYDKLHIRTGIYLAFFLIIHISAVLAGRFLFELDTNFYFGVAGLNRFPFNLFFIPYYTLAILSFFGHIAAIHRKKMKRPLLGLSVIKQANIILITGAGIAICTLYGLTNHFKGVSIPPTYEVILGK
jgi:hypothetical protein